MKNIGESAVRLGDSRDSTSTLSPWAIRSGSWESVNRVFQPFATNQAGDQVHELYVGSFTKAFSHWFPDPDKDGFRQVLLEPGECERYTTQAVLKPDVAGVAVGASVYRTKVIDASLGRPYFWRIEEVISLTPGRADLGGRGLTRRRGDLRLPAIP